MCRESADVSGGGAGDSREGEPAGAPAPLLAVDLPWLLYRSYFALPRSIRGSGQRPVNALLGTVNALLTAVQATGPRAVAACTGAEEATYRVELFPAYHAHRDPMPEELREQWERAPDLLEAFGWTVRASAELEADDLLFSLARLEARERGRTLILTADRDLFQAVDERTAMLELARGGGPPAVIDAQEVRRRCGVVPELVPDLIALRGDPSDGIPGASGVGEKTARELLRAHGSLEGAIAGARSERPRLALTLGSEAEQLRVFKKVATLVEVPVLPVPDRSTDFAGGAGAARAFGMEALARRLEALAGAADS